MSEESEYVSGPPRSPIPYSRQNIDEADIAAVVAALQSELVTQGPRLESFEDALKEVTGARYAVAVSSGTAALHLSCLGLAIGGGDYGVVPAITFAATANCLRYVGAEVAFCDVDARTGKSGSEHFQAAIAAQAAGRQLKAFLPVSYSGSAAQMEAIALLAARHGAFVIEDAAHSIGASYRDADGRAHRSASCDHSDAAILSFHPVKHICAAEGGAVLTNDETLARRVKRLRSHGVEKGDGWQYNQLDLGYHYRMTELQAALGASQLKKLAPFVARRRELARRYQEAFMEEPFASGVRVATSDEDSSWHLFVAHFSSLEERKAAFDYFHENKVRVQVHYIPLYHHDYYKHQNVPRLPGAEGFYQTCLSLPLYPGMSDEDQRYVIELLRRFLER